MSKTADQATGQACRVGPIYRQLDSIISEQTAQSAMANASPDRSRSILARGTWPWSAASCVVRSLEAMTPRPSASPVSLAHQPRPGIPLPWSRRTAAMAARMQRSPPPGRTSHDTPFSKLDYQPVAFSSPCPPRAIYSNQLWRPGTDHRLLTQRDSLGLSAMARHTRPTADKPRLRLIRVRGQRHCSTGSSSDAR